jgi:general secretion pathway protein D
MTSNQFCIHQRSLFASILLLLAAGEALAQTQARGQAGQGGGRGGIVTGGNFTGGGGGGGASSSTNGTRQYTNSTLMGDAVITSDMDTRRLIVVTDEATNENIRTVIAGLDKPKPQVLINVVFLQVTHDKDLDLGTGIAQGNATSNFGLTADAINAAAGPAAVTANAAAAAQNPSIYGMYYSIIGRDVNATIHALASTNKTEILSRPSILTRSNQQAMIMVGQTVPLTTGSRIDATSGATINTVSYQDIGIILRVTPFITADGMVEMIVTPEISSLSQTTVNVGPGATAPVIDKRSADTVVVTPSDQTVVIGGLISNENTDVEYKVPLLGDIPLLGYAFKHRAKTQTKTELLIFLTPHVVQRPEDLGRLAQTEQTKLELAPKTFDKDEVNKFIGAH